MRLESSDSDRTLILSQLRQLPHLESIELIAGDPFPETEVILNLAVDEFESNLPNVKVTITTQ